jgi:type IV pilus assembly protein PilN
LLVEINLLPQKQRKSSTSLRIVLLMALLLLLLSLLMFWQVHRYNNEINKLHIDIAKYEQSITSIQQDVNAASTSSYVELSNAVEWAANTPIKSVAVLKHLSSLLPERGFLLTYSYTESGTLSLSVQFDTKKEAAYYLKWLNDSAWIEEVRLSSLSSSQIETTAESNLTLNETESKNQNDTYLPRYTGNFEITLNRESILLSQQVEGSKDQQEGGVGE